MSDIFNEDFVDFIDALNKAEVRYVLIGGYSVILHGYNRTTGDLDIFVECTKENYARIKKAFQVFRMPLFGMTEDRFLDRENFEVFEYGNPPVSIDIITGIKGVTFDEAYGSARWHPVTGDVRVRVIRKSVLIKAKLASGRARDIDDIENLKDG